MAAKGNTPSDTLATPSGWPRLPNFQATGSGSETAPAWPTTGNGGDGWGAVIFYRFTRRRS